MSWVPRQYAHNYCDMVRLPRPCGYDCWDMGRVQCWYDVMLMMRLIRVRDDAHILQTCFHVYVLTVILFYIYSHMCFHCGKY